MKCDEARELVSGEHDGALTAGERAGLQLHLAGCAGCARHQRELRAVLGVLGKRGEAIVTPPDVRRRLESAFGPRRRRSRTVLLAAAGCLVLALVGWWSSRPRDLYVDGATAALALEREGSTRVIGAGQGLQAGDLLRSEGGWARLALDGAWATLDGRTTLRVGRRPTAAHLGSGRAAFEVLPGRGQFRVGTPAGEVVVTGTAFQIEVVPMEREVEMKKLTMGLLGGATLGALVLVQVTRGSVSVEAAGRTLPLGAGEAAELVAGRAPRRVASAPGERLADHLERQNAALRAEVERLHAEVDRGRPKGPVKTTTDVRAPLTTDERRLLGAANLRVGAETRRKLAALYQQTRGKAAPAELDELALGKELIKELRFTHIPLLGRSGPEAEAGLPPTAVKAMAIFRARTDRLTEELARALPRPRAQAVANTVRLTTHVGTHNAIDTEVDVTQGVPPGEGEPLPERSKSDKR